MKTAFYAGSYASAEHTGIYQYELNTEKGTLIRQQAISGVENPSYLLLHPQKKVMYAVEELNPAGRIAVFSMEKGEPEYLYSLPTNGADPCQLSLDEEGKHLFVSNYSSGSLAVYELDEAGKPIRMSDFKQHEGHSMNADRQECAHVHFSRMRDGKLYVCDLGKDQVVVYQFDKETGLLKEADETITFPAGNGPRHLVFSEKREDILYVVAELTSDVFVLKECANGFEIIQQISSLPAGFEGENTAAAIKLSSGGNILFVSNRGADCISSFLIQEDGTLKMAEIADCGGNGPRDFTVFGEWIVCANQYSDALTVLRYEEESGKMSEVKIKAEVSKPVMIHPVFE